MHLCAVISGRVITDVVQDFLYHMTVFVLFSGLLLNLSRCGITIKGECLPGARPARYLSINYPTSARDLPSHGEAPQIDHDGLRTFPAKHVAK